MPDDPLPVRPVEKIEPIVLLLFCGIVFFTLILIAVDWLFKGEGQVFQVAASVVSGFMGGFLTRIKPRENPPQTTQVQVGGFGKTASASVSSEPAPEVKTDVKKGEGT